MKELIKYGFILGIICFLSSSVLAVVNTITEPKIKEQKLHDENIALQEVMAGCALFKPHMKQDKIDYYLAFDRANALKGFVLKSECKGYSSTIEILAGINLNLEITEIKILSQNETPGLGSRIAEPDFRAQFKGKTLQKLQEVQAITGATISSSAVINAMKNTLAGLSAQLLEEIRNAR